MRVLIADDDLTSRLALAGVLRKQGHDVVIAVDGTEAWDAMDQPDAPRLAILDWQMPGLSGVDVCRRVRTLSTDPRPYLILLTSRTASVDIVVGLEAGADDYVAKPFDAAELCARIDVGRRMIEAQTRLVDARDALSQAASHDSLTGALNRRAFTEVLTREIAREGRQQEGLAIGICDIDYFKHVNDSRGHLVGDDVLREVVRRMTCSLRAHDALGRLGGDEFMVLAAGVSLDGARLVYERLSAAATATPIPTCSGDVSITLSFGVTMWTAGESEHDLLAAADAALYEAKERGRNRVCVANGAWTARQSLTG